jgi:hypothetical protein
VPPSGRGVRRTLRSRTPHGTARDEKDPGQPDEGAINELAITPSDDA